MSTRPSSWYPFSETPPNPHETVLYATAHANLNNIETPSGRQTARYGRVAVRTRLHTLFQQHRSSPASNPTSAYAPVRQTVATPVPPKLPNPLKVKVVSWNMHGSLPKGNLEELFGPLPTYPMHNPPLKGGPQSPEHDVHSVHPYQIVVVAGQECPTISGLPLTLAGLPAGFGGSTKERDKTRPKFKDNMKDEEWRNKSSEDVVDNHKESGHAQYGNGWSSMIDSYLSRGAAPAPAGQPFHPDVPHAVGSPSSLLGGDTILRQPGSGTIDQANIGPYELLEKERMMGIYLAIYIHRDIQSLVKGTSKSFVAAGRMGGNLGDKGGVAVSVNIAGTTMLFMNVHLAAHEGKSANRLANMAKIKAELDVETWLRSDDPRKVAENITDRFDHTFICGDLNFRLNTTFLHANLLISRKEFAEALAFDELRSAMAQGKEFVGFREGPINFPPTFKYDVPQSLKQKKGKTKSEQDIQAKAPHGVVTPETQDVAEDGDNGEDDDEDFESLSADASSFFSSAKASTIGTDLGLDWLGALQRKTSIRAAQTTAKWKSLISRVASSSRSQLAKSVNSVPTSLDRLSLQRSRSQSMRSGGARKIDQDDCPDEGETEICDTYSQKRVPSWCDRILFKSTVVPDPERDLRHRQSRSRLGVFFAQTLSTLSRKSSLASFHSDTHSSEPHTGSFNNDTTIQSTNLSDGHRSSFPRGPQSPPTDVEKKSELPWTPGSSTRSQTSLPHLVSRVRRWSHSASTGRFPAELETNGAVASASLSPAEGDSESPGALRDSHLSRRVLQPFSFLSRDTTSATSVDSISQHPPHRAPRKGDMECLAYNTLDDQAFRRLGSRSDHRPVIGVYAVYL